MNIDEQLLQIIRNETNVILAEHMCDKMKKEVLIREMKRLKETIPFINKGMDDAFKEQSAIVVIRKNKFKSTDDMINSNDYTQDYTFTLRTNGGRIIGEMIYDEEELKELHKDPNVYFMTDNFVTYSDNTTPGEKQFFVVEGEKSNYFTKKDLSNLSENIIVAIPSVETDYYIKEQYNLQDHNDFGTIIVGYTPNLI